MVLAVPSWRSWCCSLPVCLHGLCCQAIPARERQREHGWGSTKHGTPALRQALFCGGWAALGDTYWGILVWGAVVEGEVQLGGHLSEATAGGAKRGRCPRGPIWTILGKWAVTGLYWCRGAAGGTLTEGHWAGALTGLRSESAGRTSGKPGRPAGGRRGNQRFWAR